MKPSFLQEWLDEGKASAFSFPERSQFIDMLEKLPWNSAGTGLDLQQLSMVEINLNELNIEQIMTIVNATDFAEDTHIGFVYVGNVGHDGTSSNLGNIILVCEKKFGINNLDYAYSTAPGRQWCIGIKEENGQLVPNLQHFFESDGVEKIYIRSHRF